MMLVLESLRDPYRFHEIFKLQHTQIDVVKVERVTPTVQAGCSYLY